jgi:RNA-binding motif protein, X-linked 2
MNTIRDINQRNEKELELGLSLKASWHDKYKESAYIYIGGIDYDLSEGDLVRVFSQYGEVVDIHIVRDEATGASKGFCYLAYEDQRSTNLAVDNFNGIKLGDRLISVDHKLGYFRKIKTGEDGSEEVSVEKSLLLRQLEGEIPTEKELEEKKKRKEEKKLKKEEKKRIKEEKKRKREEFEFEEVKLPSSEMSTTHVGPQRPKPKQSENSKEVEPTKEELEQQLRDQQRREKYYSKEFFFDQNINENPENISNRQHYEQSYLYGLNQPHQLSSSDSRFGYDHLRYYDSLTHKDKEHKEKKEKHKEKIVKKINKY